MKPVALVERAIRNSSKSQDIVLDPFAGSGTTLMAAEATGRTRGARRARSALLRRDRQALAGGDRGPSDARRRAPALRGGCSRAGLVAAGRGGRVMTLSRAQPPSASLLEACTNVLVGYLLALVMQGLFYPLFGITTTLVITRHVAPALLLSVAPVRADLMRGRKPKPTRFKGHRGQPGKAAARPACPEAAAEHSDLPGSSLPDRKGGVEAARAADAYARHHHRPRSRSSRGLHSGLWPLGRGGAQAQGNPPPDQAAVGLHPAESVAFHRHQAAGSSCTNT